LNSIPPFLIPLLGALLLYGLKPKFCNLLFVAICSVLFFYLLLLLDKDAKVEMTWLSLTLTPLKVDALSLVFGSVFSLLLILGGIFAYHLIDKLQQIAALLYGSAALCVIFAGDLLTLLIGWEVMALASAILIFQNNTKSSHSAALRYLFVHLVGGTVLLSGILWCFAETLSLEFRHFDFEPYSVLILLGVAINAAIVPFHAWLPDAYPKATTTGAIFLGALTTKTAVYVLARGFHEWEILILAGVIMAVYGLAYALVQNDIRRILAYDIVSQVGFMVAAIGIGGHSGINAAAAHAFAHVLYNALLFMSVGSLIFVAGRSSLIGLLGFGRSIPLIMILYMIGAFSVSAFPGFGAFGSKYLILHAAEEQHLNWVVLLLYLTSVGTFVAVGLRVPYLLLLNKSNYKPKELPGGMLLGMVITGVFCIGLGVAPGLLFERLPYETHISPYSMTNIMRTAHLIVFASFAFWIFRNRFFPIDKVVLDTDWFYRKAGLPIKTIIQMPLERLFSSTELLVNKVTDIGIKQSADEKGFVVKVASSRFSLGVAIASVVLTLGAMTLIILINSN
tara:strand:+ start:186 stop:1874 length:1689 start_codon:yes stop_codon:yes gene_type:complete